MQPGPVTVITGASSGIGAATAHELSRRGHRLVLAARNSDRLQATAESLAPAEALTVIADVTSRADVERIRDDALHRFGRIDVWINNAGRGITRSVLDLTDDDVDEMMAINVRSVLYGAGAVIPHFREHGSGHFVTISSFLGRVPMAPQRSAYSAAKAAVNSLMTNLRMELAQNPGIHVTTVMPGLVATNFAGNVRGAADPEPSGPPRHSSMQPQTAEDVAAVIARVIESPVPEVYTNPASAELARQFFERIGAFRS